MHTKKIITTILIIIVGLNVSSFANWKDTSSVLTLDHALALAEANNTEILKSLANIKNAKADQQQLLAAFLPSVDLSYNYSTTNDPLYAFGNKLQQGIVTQNDFNPDLLNNPDRIDHFNSQIKVAQPIINLDAWMAKSATNHAIKAAEYQSDYTKEHIRFIVKQTYYALQLAEEKQLVLSKALKATEAHVAVAEDNMKQGYLKITDVLAVKVRLLDLEAKVKEAEDQIQSVSEMLNFLLGRELKTKFTIADNIEKVEYTNYGTLSVSNRSDVKAMHNGLEAQKLMKKSSSMKFLPRVNGFGMYNLYDSEFASFDSNSWMVGLSLQWKIFNGGKNIGSINKSKAQLHKTELSYKEYIAKENIELSKAIRNIEVKKSQAMSYQLAAEQAKESMRIISERYKEGLERTSDLLANEASYEESELKRINAIYQFNIAVFKYELLASQSNR
ncbi:TolC family protein [Carboxylicivirga linearis]|uniref:TolC family protein n=1 Tax=Carboxylicivirga linearis TaxID=1628157 RepID=A0ABS5JVI8_9BACT|nr:TolC family protein [Carboxylicivirga linearis]MBS2098902.1 TolC family protein [Carboxylicivirga linearis]